MTKQFGNRFDYEILEDISQRLVILWALEGVLGNPGDGHAGAAHLFRVDESGMDRTPWGGIFQEDSVPLLFHPPFHVPGKTGKKALGRDLVDPQGPVQNGLFAVSLIIEDYLGDSPPLGARDLVVVLKAAIGHGQGAALLVGGKP